MTTSLNKVSTIRVSWQTNSGFEHTGNGDNGTILKRLLILYNVQKEKKENHKTKAGQYEKEQEYLNNYTIENLEIKQIVITIFKS